MHFMQNIFYRLQDGWQKGRFSCQGQLGGALFTPTSTKDNDLQQKPTNQNPEVKIHSTVLAKWVNARPLKTYIDMGAGEEAPVLLEILFKSWHP